MSGHQVQTSLSTLGQGLFSRTGVTNYWFLPEGGDGVCLHRCLEDGAPSRCQLLCRDAIWPCGLLSACYHKLPNGALSPALHLAPKYISYPYWILDPGSIKCCWTPSLPGRYWLILHVHAELSGFEMLWKDTSTSAFFSQLSNKFTA